MKKIIKSIYNFIFVGGYQAIMLYRVSNILYQKGFRFLPVVITRINIILNNIEISPQAQLSKTVIISHGIGTVIGGGCKIGENVLIRQNVTLGQKGTGNPILSSEVHPIVQDNVVIGAGTCILGGITIGKNSIIGANSVVTKDVPPNTVWAGVPAKQISVIKK